MSHQKCDGKPGKHEQELLYNVDGGSGRMVITLYTEESGNSIVLSSVN